MIQSSAMSTVQAGAIAVPAHAASVFCGKQILQKSVKANQWIPISIRFISVWIWIEIMPNFQSGIDLV